MSTADDRDSGRTGGAAERTGGAAERTGGAAERTGGAAEPVDGADSAADGADAPFVPTPEQLAERARRANKATRGGLAGILGLEAVIVLLIPRAIAFTSGLGEVRTTILITVAVVLVIGAGLVRRPFGIGLGSVLQLVFMLTGIMIATMFLVGAIFIAIWLRILLLRHEIVGTPGGVRMLTS